VSQLRVVFLARLAKEDVAARLRSIAGLDVLVTEDIQDAVKGLQGADCLVTPDIGGDDGKRLAAALQAPGRTVRWVQCLTAGYEGLVRHGFPDDLVLTNQGGAVAPAVAEHAFALMLALVRRVPEAVMAKERHQWDRSFATTTGALEGRALAVVGFGNIGRQVARRARAFDMTVLGVTRSGRADALADEMHPVSSLQEVLGRADAIVIAAPETPQTHHMIGAGELAACRREAILVNVSRGGLVDPHALLAALQNRSIAGAGLDVTEPEPLPQDHPLWACPNLVISPHIAGGGSKKSRGRILDVLSENVALFRAGKPLKHAVSY
jgi:phosphoglycerate dehydrogenase-like enzyme